MMTTMGDIEETLDRFIRAFNKLQLDEMVACYNEDATAFFPVAHHHARLKGREAIRGTFERVLERIKASGATRARGSVFFICFPSPETGLSSNMNRGHGQDKCSR